jgi:hypothetical protein
MRERLREADTVGGERVECGSFNLLVSVAADVVGAQGIDGDKKHVGGRVSCRNGLPPASGPRQDNPQPEDAQQNGDPSHERSA